MMKELSIFMFFIGLGFSSAAQINRHRRTIEPLTDTLTQTPISVIGTPSHFNGGMAKFYKYVNKKLRYPRDAKRLRIEGKVFVEFVVEKDGSIPYYSVKIAKGIFESCDKEALRIIRESPKWIPGYSTDTREPVAQRMVLPIFFKL